MLPDLLRFFSFFTNIDKSYYIICTVVALISALIEGLAVQSAFTSENPLFAIFLMFISSLLRLVNTICTADLTKRIGNNISKRVFKSMLCNPHQLLTVYTNSTLTTSLVFMVDTVGYSCLTSSILLITSLSSILFISYALIIGGGKSFFLILLAISLYFILATLLTKNQLYSNSELAKIQRQMLLKTINATLIDIRRLYLDHLVFNYTSNYNVIDKSLRTIQSQNILLTSFPRIGFEILLWGVLQFYIS